ncbi:hypothetical protein [Candidatus Magnetobacterium casense]|uniref:Transposase n=1 Tax=Candidatus Magnetobacterium casense TaxID=1455061 RepID=A0ABS6RXH7_9BACT|nr:hypothetical protein [Candidatus Magnetobacterium casensis]MBV6341065.1 hypothetical protein [Candidatus Magnetobacterium casensis]
MSSPGIILPDSGALSESGIMVFNNLKEKILSFLHPYRIVCPKCKTRIQFTMEKIVCLDTPKEHRFKIKAVGKESCFCEWLYQELGIAFEDGKARIISEKVCYNFAKDFLHILTENLWNKFHEQKEDKRQ